MCALPIISYLPGGLKVIDHWFKVPLDYRHPEGESIRVFARGAVPNKNNDDGEAGAKLPICPSHPPLEFPGVLTWGGGGAI